MASRSQIFFSSTYCRSFRSNVPHLPCDSIKLVSFTRKGSSKYLQKKKNKYCFCEYLFVNSDAAIFNRQDIELTQHSSRTFSLALEHGSSYSSCWHQWNANPYQSRRALLPFFHFTSYKTKKVILLSLTHEDSSIKYEEPRNCQVV